MTTWVIVGPPGTGKTTSLLRCLAKRQAAGELMKYMDFGCPLEGFEPGEQAIAIMFNRSVRDEFEMRWKSLSQKRIEVTTLDSFAVRRAYAAGHVLWGCRRDEDGRLRCGDVELEIHKLRAAVAKEHNLEYSFDEFEIKDGNRVFAYIDAALLTDPVRYDNFERLVDGELCERFIGGRYCHLLATVPKVASRYFEVLEGRRAVDFTLAKIKALKLCEEYGHVAEVDTLAVDEAQDLTPAEWAMLKTCVKYRQVLAAGDPAQAIYTWRGADPALFVSMIKEARAAGRFALLTKSHRLADGVAKAALEFAKKYVLPKLDLPEELYHFEGNGRQGAVIKPTTSVISLLTKLMPEGAEPSGQIAVLTTTNETVLELLAPVALLAWSRRWTLAFLKSIPRRALALAKALRGETPLSELPTELRRIVMAYSDVVRRVGPDAVQVSLWRPRRPGQIVLDTIYTAKGLEFDTVVIADSPIRDADLYRRLIFVGLTRTKGSVYYAMA